MSAAEVTVAGVAKSFGGIPALRAIDLTVHAGEVHGILGPNGSGKSTLMKIIAGLQRPDAGSVSIDGRPLSTGSALAARRAGIVLMPQELTVVPRMSVGENVVMGVEPHRLGLISLRSSYALAEGALARVGLDVSPTTYVEDLSAVEQRMLMMVAALAGGARVLILDEPTAGLPVKESRLVVDTVSRIAGSGCTVLLVTHRLEQLRELSDRITILRDGQIVRRFYESMPERAQLVAAIAGPPSAGQRPDTASAVSPVIGAGEPLMVVQDVALDRLRGLSFEVRRGQIIGVAGLPGSGIDELIDIASARRRPAFGTVRMGIGLARVGSTYDAARAGMTFVSGNRKRMVMGDRSVATHVGLSSMGRRSRHGWVRQRIEDEVTQAALDVFGVVAGRRQPLATLSGGNQQRALMSRAVAAEAELIVAHEPTVGIDVHARDVLRAQLTAFSREHAVLVITADPDEVVGLCTTVYCLRDGTVGEVIDGTDKVTSQAVLHAIT